jgi:hypothetical protein
MTVDVAALPVILLRKQGRLQQRFQCNFIRALPLQHCLCAPFPVHPSSFNFDRQWVRVVTFCRRKSNDGREKNAFFANVQSVMLYTFVV